MRRQSFWAGLALPGVLWLLLFFFVPFYAILGVAMGSVDPILLTPTPEWNPADWDTSAFRQVFDDLFTGGPFQTVFGRTIVYVAIAIVLSVLLAYPIAYFVARHAGRFKIAILLGLVAPFFVSYLLRMLSWINLLQDDGWVNDALIWLQILEEPRNWLDGRASSVIIGLVYGYVPFMILTLYAYLDRVDTRLLEAAQDLGASRWQTFRMVTLPLSKQALLAGVVIIALPMFGDYYTPDLLSGSPNTNLIGNQINLFVKGGQQVNVGAALTVVLMLMLGVLLVYYVFSSVREMRRYREA